MTERREDNRLTGDAVADEVLIAIRQIIQAIDLHSRGLVRQFGLTVPQLVILQTVAREEKLTVGAIAKKVSLSQATVTGILERLYKRGLVLRQRSEVDRRRVVVESTEKSRELLEKAPPLLQQVFVEEFGKLEEWERMMILSSLKRIVNLMNVEIPAVSPYLATGDLSDLPSEGKNSTK